MTLKHAWRAMAFRPGNPWLVTSAHGVWQATDGERSWVPYFVAHARKVGASQAACGQYAVGWQFFWDLPFDPALPGVCEKCAELAQGEAGEE
jgi:hypothetical protein